MADDWMTPPRLEDGVRLKNGRVMTKSEKRWFDRHLGLAEHVRGWSKDPSTQVGAVIVSGIDRRWVAIGYNGFPPGVQDTPERLQDRETKYHFTQHAERAVLDNAAFDLRGATLFVTMHPCSECAKSIIAKKLACVVCPPALTREPWATSSRFAREAMVEAGIEIIEVNEVY